MSSKKPLVGANGYNGYGFQSIEEAKQNSSSITQFKESLKNNCRQLLCCSCWSLFVFLVIASILTFMIFNWTLGSGQKTQLVFAAYSNILPLPRSFLQQGIDVVFSPDDIEAGISVSLYSSHPSISNDLQPFHFNKTIYANDTSSQFQFLMFNAGNLTLNARQSFKGDNLTSTTCAWDLDFYSIPPSDYTLLSCLNTPSSSGDESSLPNQCGAQKYVWNSTYSFTSLNDTTFFPPSGSILFVLLTPQSSCSGSSVNASIVPIVVDFSGFLAALIPQDPDNLEGTLENTGTLGYSMLSNPYFVVSVPQPADDNPAWSSTYTISYSYSQRLSFQIPLVILMMLAVFVPLLLCPFLILSKSCRNQESNTDEDWDMVHEQSGSYVINRAGSVSRDFRAP